MVNPVAYASSNTLQQCNVSAIMDEFADELETLNGKCMDIGCGPGDITRNIVLPALSPTAVMIGTDISEDMIQYANEKYGDNVRTAFEVLDVQTKFLPKEYVSEFDHIFSFHALHWCSDIRQAFSNIYEMLQPGGTILMNLVASHDIFDVFNQISQNPRYASYIPDKKRLVSPFQYSTEPQKELKNMLKSVGFDVLHCSHRETTYLHVNSHTFLPAIMSFISFLDNMPKNLKTDFYEEFKSEYMQRKVIFKRRQNNEEQTVILDMYRVLVLYAKK
ncbi:juvenile hormone acid O-methyltransferase-like [Odontomachus brunneus]|uniref:juvenile hormone acid O-methyltransferase-like n=1 Tax=Odontomachus brunneus TaxID=486640 RepID=UPI0013F18408|nr:juvenile hormone acid O-methyltransferase-like [Odontomachus brunneus]